MDSVESRLYEEAVIRVLKTARGFIIETTPGWYFLVCIRSSESEWKVLYGLDAQSSYSAARIRARSRILGRLKTGVDHGLYPRPRIGPPGPMTFWRRIFRSVIRFFIRPG